MVQDDVSDEKTSDVGSASKNVKTFEQLMAELTELESRIQQSADQSASVRVIIFATPSLFSVPFQEVYSRDSGGGMIVKFGNLSIGVLF